jgi:hypothetical protein
VPHTYHSSFRPIRKIAIIDTGWSDRGCGEVLPLKIYLADLFHVYTAGRNPHISPYTVPLGIGFLASTLKMRLPDCPVALFRDPDRLLHAVRADPPDVMGFSFCSWNSDLSRRVSEIIKAACPDVITVGGGPSIDDADDQLVAFLEMFPTVDYLVPNEGESGFVALIQAIKRGEVIAGPFRAWHISMNPIA